MAFDSLSECDFENFSVFLEGG